MVTTPSSITERSIATAEAYSAQGATLIPQSVIAEIKWSVLPAAIQQAIGNHAAAWIDQNQQSFFGITILRTESTDEPFHLDAWVLARTDNNDHPKRHTIFQWNAVEVSKITKPINPQPNPDSVMTSITDHHFDNTVNHSTPRNAKQAQLHLLNGRPDRLSIDVTTESGHPICRLTYVIHTNGKTMWWAYSILPSLLNLEGGRYELKQVTIPALANE